MDLQSSFQQSVDAVQKLTQRPSNEELLKLYGLFKQATDGDVTGERPGGFDFKGIAKFDSWSEQKGKSKEVAMKEYVDTVTTLLSKYS